MGQREVEIAVRHFDRIGRIGKADFFGEGIFVQPVDQPFTPRGDDGGLGVVHMGVNKAGRNQRLAVVGEAGHWVSGPQSSSRPDRPDQAALDQHGFGQAGGGDIFKRVAGKGQHLPQEQIGHGSPQFTATLKGSAASVGFASALFCATPFR